MHAPPSAADDCVACDGSCCVDDASELARLRRAPQGCADAEEAVGEAGGGEPAEAVWKGDAVRFWLNTGRCWYCVGFRARAGQALEDRDDLEERHF